MGKDGAIVNPWQALIEKNAVDHRKDWPEPVKTNGRNMNTAAKRHAEANMVLLERLRQAMPRSKTISVDEWLRTLPPSESYQTRRGRS